MGADVAGVVRDSVVVARASVDPAELAPQAADEGEAIGTRCAVRYAVGEAALHSQKRCWAGPVTPARLHSRSSPSPGHMEMLAEGAGKTGCRSWVSA